MAQGPRPLLRKENRYPRYYKVQVIVDFTINVAGYCPVSPLLSNALLAMILSQSQRSTVPS